jgi:hypothetical protein
MSWPTKVLLALTCVLAMPPALVPAQETNPEKAAAAMVTPAAEKAIEDGLTFLAAHQQEDGSFGTGGYRGNVALCGLAGLAFLSSGSTPDRGPYGRQVSKCIDYLLLHAKESGFIVQPESAGYGPMYGHGYATLFLAECHGMSQRLGLRDKLTKAVALIVETQNKDGGWRYQPQRLDADISVTVTQVMALRAAKNAGIHVAQETVDRCIDYVKKSQNPDGGFMYMITGGESAFARSAAGVVALQSAGIYEGPEITKGLAYLTTFLPQADVARQENYYYYGHYYAVQAMWHAGGENWNRWYPAVRDELIANQHHDGSWNDAISDDFATSMALLVLQTPNNYLPIFQR